MKFTATLDHRGVTASKLTPAKRNEIRKTLAAALRPHAIAVTGTKWPMKAGAASKKGASWERDFCKELSLWWTRGRHTFVFERRSGSGGSRRDKLALSGESGDLIAIMEEGRPVTSVLSFELKAYRDLTGDLWNFLTGSEASQFWAFIQQALDAAALYKRAFVLVARTNQRAPLVVTNSSALALMVPGGLRMHGAGLPDGLGLVTLFPMQHLWEVAPEELQRELTLEAEARGINAIPDNTPRRITRRR